MVISSKLESKILMMRRHQFYEDSHEMRQLIKYLSGSCWAVGAEFLLPLILLIVLLKEKEGGNDNETNQSDHGFKSDDA